MSCDPNAVISSQALSDLNKDIQTIDDVVESNLDTTTTKDGKVINTLEGQLKLLGYETPVVYAAAIEFTSNDNTKTIERNKFIYAPLPSALPFTTSGTWTADDEDKFFVVQGLTTGSSEVVLAADTVADMKTKDLQSGQIIRTKVNNTTSNAGGALYLIKTAAEYGGTPDGFGDHTLANGNVAVLQHEGRILAEQYGAAGDYYLAQLSPLVRGISNYYLTSSYTPIINPTPTDDTLALQAAMDNVGVVQLSDYGYAFTQLNINGRNLEIHGTSINSALVHTGTGNAINVSTTTSSEHILFNLIRLIGNANSTAGIVLGDGTLYVAFFKCENSYITGFSETGASGVQINSAQEVAFEDTWIGNNDIGVLRQNVGYSTSTLFSGGRGYVGRNRIGFLLDGLQTTEFRINGIVIEDNNEEGLKVINHSIKSLWLEDLYLESNCKTGGDGVFSISGEPVAYGNTIAHINRCHFHGQNTVPLRPNLVLDRVDATVSNCTGIHGNNGITTTANTTCHFDMNRGGSAADYYDIYNNLLGKISARDIDVNNTPFFYVPYLIFRNKNEVFTDNRENLDWFSRGSFVPELNNVTPQTGIAYWQRCGGVVQISFELQFPVTADTNDAVITNLPFSGVGGGGGGLAVGHHSYTTTPVGRVNGSQFEFWSGLGFAQLTNADLSNVIIKGEITYMADVF